MSAPADACLNCELPFAAPRPRYCPACGQESRIRAPTLREFAQQFGGSYIAAEGALWRTLKLLFTRPGALTVEYLAGRRRRYVLPLRLYLTISVVTLVLMRSMAQIDLKLDTEAERSAAERPEFDMRIGGGSFGLRGGAFFCEQLPGWACTRLQRRLDIDPKSLPREMAAWSDRLLGHVGAAMFVLLPWFALWLRAVYANRRLHVAEHLVFALHVHAFWFAMLALALLKLPWISGLAAAAMPVYTLLAMRRVYRGRWRWLLLRAAFVAALYGAMLALAMAGLAVWAFVF